MPNDGSVNGVSVAAGVGVDAATPCPLKLIVAGLAVPLWTMDNAPVFAPADPGVNMTLSVQV